MVGHERDQRAYRQLSGNDLLAAINKHGDGCRAYHRPWDTAPKHGGTLKAQER